MTSNTDKELANIMYSYTSDISELEEENKMLKQSVNQLKNELDRFRTPPLMVCEVRELHDKNAVIRVPNGNHFFVFISEYCDNLKAGDTVLVEQKHLNVVRKFNRNKSFNVEQFVIMERPNISFCEIGGLAQQIQEIKEVVELPLTKPDLFRKVGIQPPKGLLLFGPPGTGKTLLAKAVANSTDSTFIEVVGSELVQKFIGEGAKLVKEIFELAKEKAPTIIFIDEVDALAAKRMEIGTSGEREVQRTFMQLLAEIDGFNPLGNVKVIGCTNRKDILDSAVLRPGRLDRLISVPLPNNDGLKEIFKIHTRAMTLEREINLTRIYMLMEGFSGAEVKSVCTEAGYFAIRDDRVVVTEKDIVQGIEKVKQQDEHDTSNYLTMFG